MLQVYRTAGWANDIPDDADPGVLKDEIIELQYGEKKEKVHKSKIKHNWAFSNMVSIIRQQLMDYINIYRFPEDPEKAWRSIINENDLKYQNTLFPEIRGAYY